MIKKLFIAPILLVIAAGFATPHVSAQVRPRMNRILKEQRLESAGDPQVGQRRFPPGGVNRPPLNMPQGNRQPGANQARKQRLQQMLMQRLDLRPEQRLRMQEIRRSHDDEVISTGRRLRQAHTALDRAIMSENYNEEAVRRAVESYSGEFHIGIAASGGLSHFLVDEEFDRAILKALADKDAAFLQNLPRNKLNAGSREMQQQKREMQQERMGPAEPLNPTARPPLEDDELDLLNLLVSEN